MVKSQNDLDDVKCLFISNRAEVELISRSFLDELNTFGVFSTTRYFWDLAQRFLEWGLKSRNVSKEIK